MTTPTTIYGIKNCDTMKRALTWLTAHNIPHIFHDYKTSGADAAIIEQAIAQHGWENTINRKGTSWRTLPVSEKSGMTDKSAVKAALANPSLIRRPLLLHEGKIHLGFTEASYSKIFK